MTPQCSLQARQCCKTLHLTVQIHAHFRERKERETTYEFAQELLEDLGLQNKPTILTNVAFELCNIQKKTTRSREQLATYAQLQKTKKRSCTTLHQ